MNSTDDDRDSFNENVFSVDDVSLYLLDQKFYLTALEYYAENLERGLEVSKLKAFFSNPENFDRSRGMEQIMEGRMRTSPSISTIDSADFSKNSDDGNQIQEDKIKILEFELRKRENEIQKLRRELTHAVTAHSNGRREDIEGSTELSVNDTNVDSELLLTPVNDRGNLGQAVLAHERRALNFLIYQYLLQEGMKLTSISFTEEVPDQNLECWDDVGLNVGQPPDLFGIFRAFVKPIRNPRSNVQQLSNVNAANIVKMDMSTQTTVEDTRLSDVSTKLTISSHMPQFSASDGLSMIDIGTELENLKSTNHLLAAKVFDLERRNQILMNSIQQSQISRVSGSSVNMPVEVSNNMTYNEVTSLIHPESRQKVPQSRPPPEGDENLNLDSGRRVSPAFKDALETKLISRETVKSLHSKRIPFSGVTTLDELIKLLAEIMPDLVNLLDSAHVQMIFPLLLPVIKLHPDNQVREELLKLLFNIYSKPSSDEKFVLLYYLRLLAAELGPSRVESEILPHIWGEISGFQTRASPQRRQLIAEACGIIAPYVTVAMRGSLILSVLQQLIESENDSSVLCAAVRSLAKLVCCISDIERLHGPLLSLLKACVHADRGIELLSETARATLLPCVAQWCMQVHVLHSALLDGFLMDLDTLLAMNSTCSTNASIQRCIQSLHIIEDLTPYIYAWVLLSAPAYDQSATSLNNVDDVSYVSVFENSLPPLFRPSNLFDDKDTYVKLKSSYDAYCRSGLPLTSSGAAPWPAVQWMASELLPKLGQLLKVVSPSFVVGGRPEKRTSSQYEWDSGAPDSSSVHLCSSVCCILRSMVLYLGPQLSEQLLLSWVKKEMFVKSKRNLTELNCDLLPTSFLAAYLSLLATSVKEADQIELKKSITNLVFLLASADTSLFGMRLAIFTLRCSPSFSNSQFIQNAPNPLKCQEGNPLTMADIHLLELTFSSLEPSLSCSSDEKVCVCGARLLLTLLHRICIESSILSQRTQNSQSEAPRQTSSITNSSGNSTNSEGDNQWSVYTRLLRLLESAWTRMDCLWREGASPSSSGNLVGLKMDGFGQMDSVIGSSNQCNWPCAVVMLHTVVMLLGKLNSLEWKHKLYSTVQHVMTAIIPFTGTNNESGGTALNSITWTRWNGPQWDCLLSLLQLVMAVGPTAPEYFRDQELLPWLLELVKWNAKNEDHVQRVVLARLIVSAVSAVTYYIPDKLIDTHATPILSTLRQQFETDTENSTLLRDIDNFTTDLLKRTSRRSEELGDESVKNSFLMKFRGNTKPHASSGIGKSTFANLFSGLGGTHSQ